MKIFVGLRTADGRAVVHVEEEGSARDLSPRLDIVNHSPDGFEWGYGGSGPAQLALAILIDCYDVDFAVRNYQEFKWKVVSRFPHGGFVWTDLDTKKYAEKERLK